MRKIIRLTCFAGCDYFDPPVWLEWQGKWSGPYMLCITLVDKNNEFGSIGSDVYVAEVDKDEFVIFDSEPDDFFVDQARVALES